MKVKTVNGAAIGLAQEVTSNAYDDNTANGHAGYFNTGQLTDATRSVATQTVSGIAFPAVAVTQRFDHDLAGRLKRERHVNVAGAERSLQYAYYSTGELHSKQMANGVWTGAYSYDLAGRLYGVGNSLFTGANGATEPSSFIASTLYNARGQTTAITYGSGRSASYTYQDNRGFLTRMRALNGATTLMDQTYTPRFNGQIGAIAMAGDTARSWTYTYDAYGQLTLADNLGNGAMPTGGTPSGEDRTYAYDLAGNMTQNSGLCAGATNLAYPTPCLAGATSLHRHGPSTICGTAVTYDANGNTLAYDSDGAGPKPARALVYDGENRPIAVTRNGLVTAFQYGPDGERTRKATASATSLYISIGEQIGARIGDHREVVRPVVVIVHRLARRTD